MFMCYQHTLMDIIELLFDDIALSIVHNKIFLITVNLNTCDLVSSQDNIEEKNV